MSSGFSWAAEASFLRPCWSVERSLDLHDLLRAVVLDGMATLQPERSMERTLPVLEWDRWAALLVLVLTVLALSTRKGSDLHRFAGKAFMVLLMVTGAVFIYRGFQSAELLIAFGGVWSVHLGSAGVRALHLKKLHQGLPPARPDLVLHGVPALFYTGLVVWGLGPLLGGHPTGTDRALVLAGGVGIATVVFWMRRFRSSRIDRKQWLFDHMTGMLGAAAVLLATTSWVHLDEGGPPFLASIPLLAGILSRWAWGRYHRVRSSDERRSRRQLDIRIR